MSPKRACDTCISRKVKCNGSWPCDTCRGAVKKVQCTYLKPARRRGPKARRTICQVRDIESSVLNSTDNESYNQENENVGSAEDTPFCQPTEVCSQRIPKTILESVVRLYQRYSYSVWPVVNAEGLLLKIEDIDPEKLDYHTENISCLITALCAATMAQLHLDPQVDDSRTVSSTAMAQTCLQMRAKCCDYGEHMDFRSILVSFFLHVYHAKVNQRNSAMMYIQEAIAGVRVLRLDEGAYDREDDIISNKTLVFPLIWVSERGYALHLGLSPSYSELPTIPELESDEVADVDAHGLLELVKLFIAFDRISVRRSSRVGITVAADLTETEKRLTSLCFTMADRVSTRTADYHITREWMRTILWQDALSMGLLSSSAHTSVMKFGYPAQVGRDLLQALRRFRDTDLVPLGRDQLLKCFEVANSLADTILLTLSGAGSRLELGPQDFLHALYQKITPFLDQDEMLKSILRAKTAEALVTAPARLLTVEPSVVDLHSRHEPVPVVVSENILYGVIDEQNESSTNSFDWLSQLNQQIF